jgi:hypothetical protein
MRIDKKTFKDVETVATLFILLPAVAIAVVKFIFRARKDLRLPNNDMWE